MKIDFEQLRKKVENHYAIVELNDGTSSELYLMNDEYNRIKVLELPLRSKDSHCLRYYTYYTPRTTDDFYRLGLRKEMVCITYDVENDEYYMGRMQNPSLVNEDKIPERLKIKNILLLNCKFKKRENYHGTM